MKTSGVTSIIEADTIPRYDPAFDWSVWRLSRGQLAGVAIICTFAVALWQVGDATLRFSGVLLVAEAVLLCLPWRIPRSRRSPAGFWLETIVGLLAPVAAMMIVVASGARWLSLVPEWWWFLVAGVVGLLLTSVGGMKLRALISGELAFVLGPTPGPHGLARAASNLVGPPGEEVLFRAPVLVTGVTGPLALLAGIAFVARHYIPPGTNGRGTTRSLLTEIVAAGLLLLLTFVSGSVYPALLAHVVNNLPHVYLQFQCVRAGAS